MITPEKSWGNVYLQTLPDFNKENFKGELKSVGIDMFLYGGHR